MEDPRWLRLITIGLVLAALAVGYFLISGRFVSKPNITKAPTQTSQATPTPSASASATPRSSVLGQNTRTDSRSATASPSPGSAFSRIASRNQAASGQDAQVLPRTGFPVGLVAVLSISVMISGWGLRRFPH